MNFKDIQELIKLIQKSNLSEFKLKDGEFELSIRTDKFLSGKQPQWVAPPAVAPGAMPAPAVPPAPSHEVAAPESTPATDAPKASDSAEYLALRSPMVGTFYRSSSPEKGPYVKVGDLIEKGDVVCIVEAMKLFNEIEAEHGGRIVKVLVEDAQPVEYDQILFLIDPKG
jgi:acetyl-CoA carboxylase biotin carboxyl carrier protein